MTLRGIVSCSARTLLANTAERNYHEMTVTADAQRSPETL
jgi:hypothetical protein